MPLSMLNLRRYLMMIMVITRSNDGSTSQQAGTFGSTAVVMASLGTRVFRIGSSR